MYGALKAFDGDKTNQYDLGVAVRWNIAKNLLILQKELAVIDKISRDLLSSNKLVEGEAVTKENHSRIQKYVRDFEQLSERDVKVDGLLSLKKQDIDALPLPPSIICDLIATDLISQ
jgi:hypothetical protein